MVNDRARQMLVFIQQFTNEHGFPPTIREIGKEFRIASTNGVRYYLHMLERSGQLKRSNRISRGIGAVSTASPRVRTGIPILGRVAAGAPSLAAESFEGDLALADMFGDANGLFALRVRGDSMVDAGILEGDYVVVRKQERATAGQIVVGLLGEEATVKYYQPRGARIELVAANENYAPIQIGPDSEFQILGIVTGVIRTVSR